MISKFQFQNNVKLFVVTTMLCNSLGKNTQYLQMEQIC